MPDIHSKFPNELDTNASLLEANNNAVTKLSESINNSITTLPVVDTSSFPNTGLISIDSEIILYSGKTQTSFTGCIRGIDGSTNVSHDSQSSVEGRFVSAHHKVLVEAILALQNKIGIGTGFPINGKFIKSNVNGASSWENIVPEDVEGLSEFFETYNDNDVVHKSTIETISGKKTFTTPPVVPTPSNDNEAVNKGFVNTSIETAKTVLRGISGSAVQNLNELKSITANNRVDKQLRLVEDEGIQYRFDTESIATPTATDALMPNDLSPLSCYVSNAGDPNVNGRYIEEGVYDGVPYFKHDTLTLYIYRRDGNFWMICWALGEQGFWALYRFENSATDFPPSGTWAQNIAAAPAATVNLASGRWFKSAILTQEHNSAAGIQGGSSNERYHLTAAELNRIPSSDTDDALEGTGIPSNNNKFVTENTLSSKADLNHAHITNDISGLVEFIQDSIAEFFIAGSGINFTYDDINNTFTVINSSPLTTEQVQDIIGNTISSGSNANVTYDDIAGTLVISGAAPMTTEEVQDIVGTLLTQGTNVTLNYNDASNTLTISASGSTTIASQAEAEAGSENTKTMTPLRVKQSIIVNSSSSSGVLDIPLIAGENLTINNPTYLELTGGEGTPGRVYKTDSSFSSRSSQCEFTGFATSNVSTGNSVNIRRLGLLGGFSGLTPGKEYYIGTSGNIINTAPANSKRIGFAVDSTTLLIDPLYSSTVIATGILADANIVQKMLPSGLIGSTWTDLARGNNGTLTGATIGSTTRNGNIINIATFSGGSQYIEGFSALIAPVGTKTISIWARSTDITARRGLLGTRPSSGNGFFFGFDVSSGLRLRYARIGGGDSYASISGYTQGNWAMFSMVHDIVAQTVAFYMNTTLITTVTGVTTDTTTSYNGRIGGEQQGSATENWKGDISHVIVANRAFSSGEITSLYNATY